MRCYYVVRLVLSSKRAWIFVGSCQLRFFSLDVGSSVDLERPELPGVGVAD